MVYWTIALAEYLKCIAANEDFGFHATLTQGGKRRLEETRDDPCSFKPGEDCQIKGLGAEDGSWFLLPSNQFTKAYRQDWRS